MDKTKQLGQVFTPDNITEQILDMSGYTANNILGKTILEPSFGEGVFLKHIVLRIINEGERTGLTTEEIKKQLEDNVYGIEIDSELYHKTLDLLNQLVLEYGIKDVDWNLYRMDTLDFTLNGFDFIVGNPPYIRVHNLDEENRNKIKKFKFSNGTTDMYIVFFELCLNLLNENGTLGFITPNSFLRNASQKKFREYLFKNNLVSCIKDFGSQKVFDGISTYTAISILNKDRKETNFRYIDEHNRETLYDTRSDKDMVLCNQDDKQFLEEISKRPNRIGDIATVQNGFATNADSVFISEEIFEHGNEVAFNRIFVEKELVKPIVKASKYHGEGNYWVLFPYKEDGTPYSEIELMTEFPMAYNYLRINKERLEKRDADGYWYEFGRSQGLKNCHKDKLVVNTVVSPGADRVEVYSLPNDCFVYSGIYITSDNLELVKEVLSSKDFLRYALITGKPMSGGYKSINTKLINNYRYN